MQYLRSEAVFQSLFCFCLTNRKSVRFNLPKKVVQRLLEVPLKCTEERLEVNEILKET